MDIAKHTTHGLTVSVKSKFEGALTINTETPFNFSYFIEIINESHKRVQLLSREWRIFDTFGTIRKVRGEGVIGVQPIIEPGESYTYSSWCGLYAPIGNMSGYYEMINVDDENDIFQILIPKFILCADYLKN